MQQLVLQSVHKFREEHWDKIARSFEKLFESTTAHSLFSPETVSSINTTPVNSADALKINGIGGEEVVSEAQSTSVMDEPELEDFNRVSDASTASASKRKEFKQIIVKCVLQLLLIDTVSELLSSDDVYETIPSDSLLAFMAVLKKSYQFARKFNNDRDLRMNLWRIGAKLGVV